MNIRITGTGSYIPELIKKNNDFINRDFYTLEGESIETPADIVIDKFKAITGISERRYADDKLTASDLGAFAGNKALEDAKIDPETLDYIICAHKKAIKILKSISSIPQIRVWRHCSTNR